MNAGAQRQPTQSAAPWGPRGASLALNGEHKKEFSKSAKGEYTANQHNLDAKKAPFRGVAQSAAPLGRNGAVTATR